MSAGGDSGRKPVWGRIAHAKSLGWAIYAIGFAIWLFGYLSAGHAPLFDWNAATPWWVSSFVPNFEAELGMVLMFASMIPIYWGAVRKRAFAYTALRGRDSRVVVVFGVADVAYDLGTVAKMTDRFLHADAHVRDNERWEKAHVFPIEVEHDARILLREPGNCPKKHPTRH